MTTYSKETALYDTGAIKNGIDEAATTADNYLTDVTGGGVMVHPSNDSTTGWKISSALELLKSGVSYIWAGLVNNIATVRIGKENGGHSVIDENGMRIYGNSDGNTQLANIGYGEGASSSGTVDNAPYFTFGTRIENASDYNASETYVVGDVVSYNGSIYVCYNKVSTPEPFDSNKWRLSIGNYSYTSGELNLSSGSSSHAEGASTKAIGVFSHAEGFTSKAIGMVSHSEGSGSSAVGAFSHAEGASVAEGDYSHSQNYLTEASFSYQTVIGRYNDNQQDTAFEIGNGTSDTSRSNALTVDWDGNVIGQAMAGIIQMFAGSTPPTGWLVCDGSEQLVSDYPKLAAVLGNTWGTPSSSDYFKLPDFRGRAPIGYGDGTATSHTQHNLGTYGGNEDSVVPYHNHSVNSVSIGSSGGHSHTITNKYTNNQLASGSNSPRFRTDGSTSTTNFSSIASNTGTHTHSVPSHNTNYAGTSGNTVGANMMPYATISFIICTGKTY